MIGMKDEIVALLRTGRLTRGEIARQLGVDRSRVTRVAILEGFGRIRPVSNPREIDRNAMWRLYREGKMDTEIAEELGCSHSVVSLWRQERRLPSHALRRRRSPGDRQKAAADLVQLGASYAQAAEVVGISRNAVAGAVHRARLARQGRESPA